MLVQSLGCPAQEAPRSGLSKSAPNSCTAISFETPQEWCCQPISWRCLSACLSYAHWNFLSKSFSAVLLPQSTALLTLPAQDLFGSTHLSYLPSSSTELGSSGLSEAKPASQLAVLSLLLSCSSCPSTSVPKTEAEAFALQSTATGSDHVSCSLLSCLCSLLKQVRPFSAHLLSLLCQPPFPLLLFASILTKVHPVYFRLSLPICLRLNDLHSFSPPAAQETARQTINATQTLPGLGTRYTVSLDTVGRHAKSHQPRLSYPAACKSGLKRGQRGAGWRTSTGNPAARAVALPWDFTQLWQLRNPFMPHRKTDRAQLYPTTVPLCRGSSWGSLVSVLSWSGLGIELVHAGCFLLPVETSSLWAHISCSDADVSAHWTAHKGLSKSCAENRIPTHLAANAGPKHCISARSRQDKTVQENSSNMLEGTSGSAPLRHKHTQNHPFPSGRHCQHCADMAWPGQKLLCRKEPRKDLDMGSLACSDGDGNRAGVGVAPVPPADTDYRMHWWCVPTHASLWPCHPGTGGLLGPVWRQVCTQMRYTE